MTKTFLMMAALGLVSLSLNAPMAMAEDAAVEHIVVEDAAHDAELAAKCAKEAEDAGEDHEVSIECLELEEDHADDADAHTETAE